MTCMYCGHEGHSTQEGMRACRRMREETAMRFNLAGNQAGRATAARRQTMDGLALAIIGHVKGIAYDGKTEPGVFLYVRPGALPSVKVTVELHKDEMAHAEVIFETRDEAGQFFCTGCGRTLALNEVCFCRRDKK